MMRSREPILLQETLKYLLHYCPDTGLFTRLVRVNRRVAGKVAGTLNNKGYIVIWINKLSYTAHRLAFLYMEGEFPPDDVDHINRVKNDNRWSNLRKATRGQNNQNILKHKNNKSGYLGVYPRNDRNKFRAEIGVNGKKIGLGTFDTAEQASNAYQSAKKELHEFSTQEEVI